MFTHMQVKSCHCSTTVTALFNLTNSCLLSVLHYSRLKVPKISKSVEKTAAFRPKIANEIK